jgi:tetratricopeptide (TPR) repeat protein
VSGRRAAVPAAARPGRNDPCPCGSGRKFKLCCGAAPARPSMSPTSRAASLFPLSAAADAAAGSTSSGIGPLTEVSDLREAAEAFRRRQSALPAFSILAGDAADVEHRVPPRRAEAARRHRERGIGLLEAGRLPASIAAFQRATRLDPGDGASHHALGRAFLATGRFAEAAASLRLATTLRDDAAAYRDLGMALHRQRLDLEAMAAYRRAVELAPDLAETHAALGELLETAGDDQEAAECFRRAGAAAPDTAAGRLDLARALMLENNFTEAEVQLRHAVALDPQCDRLVKYLGDVLIRQGRFAEGIEAFDCALALNPRQVAAHFSLVDSKKCTEADRPRLAQMLSTLGDPELDDEDRLLLHFACGKLLDDLGEYREAMQHFEAANQIRRGGARFNGAAFAADVDRRLRRFTPAFFAASAGFGRDDETPLLIVGMPRSGTTLVEQIISSHPQIAAGGELPFWIRRASPWGIAEATYLPLESARDLSGEYLSLLRRIGPSAARVTDKQPFNLLCLGVIHLLLPKARIIQCRRHPVDTCLSLYFTHFKQTISFVSDKTDLAAAYQHYARLMDHWRTVLPSDRLLEVDYEKLVADRESVTRQLIDFAGLDWHDSCLWPERNRRAVTTASLWQARQPVYTTSVARWRHYEPWLGELRPLLPAAGADGGPGTA